MSFMGVDIGTSGCKAVAFDAGGNQLALAGREYPTLSPQHRWAELDPAGVIESCRDCIRETAFEVRSSDAVEALGISSQGEAFTIISAKGEYLINAMTSADARSRRQVEEFSDFFGKDRLYNITGHSPHTLFSLFKLLWIKENKPRLLQKADRIVCLGDLLTYELTGEYVISYSLAARTMLFDVNKLRWSASILEKSGLKAQMLSRPAPAYACAGTVRKETAEELGLGRDVVVAPGGHDQICGALGAGVTSGGSAAYSTGTVECITPVFDSLVLNSTMQESNLASYPYALDGLYTTVAFNPTGGSLLRWYRDNLGQWEIQQAERKGVDAYELILKEIPEEPTSLLVLPHFAPTGTPWFDPQGCGAILGLDLGTTRPQLVKAILEGVTYEMRLNAEALRRADIEIDQFRAVGGGAKSSKWMQIKADIMGRPVISMRVTETACAGAAMLAAKAKDTGKPLRQLAGDWARKGKTYRPRERFKKLYDERFKIYSKMYETLRPLKQEINLL